MKDIIGIQTPHYAYNYGAQLQAFALGQAIRQLGFDIEYINRRPAYFFEPSNALSGWLRHLEQRTRGKYFEEFEKTYLQPQSIRMIHNSEYAKLNIDKYRTIVVGSDQIWRDDYYFHSFELSPYLYFFKKGKTKKVAYAASFGKSTCSHPEERRKRIAECLKDFNAISVREESGVTILKNFYGVDGVWVLDPTLLHSGAFYADKFNLKKENSNLLLTYILGAKANRLKKIEATAIQMDDIKLKHIYKASDCKLMYKRPFSYISRFKEVPSVLMWLSQIMNSKYVITDSFHGMVFCILFHKQFAVMNNVEGGSERFLCLLDKLNLSDRLFSWQDDNQLIINKLKEIIDYSHVESLLTDLKKNSLDFLKSSL